MLTAEKDQYKPNVPQVKATYEVMPLEVLKKISQMKSPQELESIRPPAKVPYPILLALGAARSGGPAITAWVTVKYDSMSLDTDGCRMLNIYQPDDPLISPQMLEASKQPSMG